MAAEQAAMAELQRQLQVLLPRQAVFESEVGRLQSENQLLVNAGPQHIPSLLTELRAARKPAVRSLVDHRGIGKPSAFSGQNTDWLPWARMFENFVGAVHPGADWVLEWAAEQVAITTLEINAAWGIGAFDPDWHVEKSDRVNSDVHVSAPVGQR